jgi:hypothetical protein
MMADSLHEDPRKSVNWRMHRSGCSNYRERWFADTDAESGEPLYQVFCFLNTPPITNEEQEKCLACKQGCWRLASQSSGRSRNRTRHAADISSTQQA